MKFSDWLKKNENMGIVQPKPPQQQPTHPAFPVELATRLQSLGPSMSNILNRAGQLIQAGTHPTLPHAIQSALSEFDKQRQVPQTTQGTTPPA